MKKVLLATALSVPMLAVSAFAADCHPKAHGGFAVGLHGGYVTAENRLSNVGLPGTAGVINYGSSDVSGRGGLIGLDLSYGHVFANKLFAGLEIKGDLQSVKGQTSVNVRTPLTFNQEVKAKESFGAALKLGGLVDKALPYLLVGVVSTKFETRLGAQNASAAIALVGRDIKKTKRLTGVEFGAGIDLPVTERMTVGGRYVHTEYSNFTSSFNDVGGGRLFDFKVKPRTNAFLLNVKYRVW
ncbi:MAG: outer membrane beta-barrel protein [Proteobacteria bacterium]|nr:outer membrane beta-barrel protein [Pseudomonadota bacterium]